MIPRPAALVVPLAVLICGCSNEPAPTTVAPSVPSEAAKPARGTKRATADAPANPAQKQLD